MRRSAATTVAGAATCTARPTPQSVGGCATLNGGLRDTCHVHDTFMTRTQVRNGEVEKVCDLCAILLGGVKEISNREADGSPARVPDPPCQIP